MSTTSFTESLDHTPFSTEFVLPREFPFPPPGINISSEYLEYINSRIMPDRKDCGLGSCVEDIWYQIVTFKDNRRTLEKHSIEVAGISQLLGRLYGMNQSQLDILGVASLLHDTGLLLYPELANKTEPFTGREKEKSREHPRKGFELLEPMKLPQQILQIVRNHHEGYTSYFDCDDENRLFVELVTISDTYCATRDHNRTYNTDVKTNDVARKKIVDLMRPNERFNPEHRELFEVFCQRIQRTEKEYGEQPIIEFLSSGLL